MPAQNANGAHFLGDSKLKTNMQLNLHVVLRNIIFLGATLLIVAGGTACTSLKPTPSEPEVQTQQKPKPQPKPKLQSKPKPADTEAAKQYYDQGLQEYSRENYQKAMALFQRVIDLEPYAELKSKAEENLKKTQQILKTLNSIETK